MTHLVTKKSVSKIQDKLYSVVFNLKLLDEVETVLLDQDFTKQYSEGEDDMEKILKEVQTEMQKTIDNYNASQEVLDNPIIDKVVGILQDNLK